MDALVIMGGEAGIDGHQAVLHLLPVGILHQMTGGHAAHEGGVLVGGEEGVLDRLGGLAHGGRSVLLHVANLLQLELHLMAAATIDHVVGHGDDDDEGDSHDEPIDVVGELALPGREHVARVFGLGAVGRAVEDVADVGPPFAVEAVGA